MDASPSGVLAMSASCRAGRIDRFSGGFAFLSNFYPSPVTYEAVLYRTVEHAFQAAKTLDRDRRRAIAHEPTPGRARRAGRRVDLRPDWEEVKSSVMGALVRQKFVTNPDLAVRLIATAPAHLEEGNRHGDRCWGTVGGVGENRLGRILMGVRAELLQLGDALGDGALSGGPS